MDIQPAPTAVMELAVAAREPALAECSCFSNRLSCTKVYGCGE